MLLFPRLQFYALLLLPAILFSTLALALSSAMLFALLPFNLLAPSVPIPTLTAFCFESFELKRTVKANATKATAVIGKI